MQQPIKNMRRNYFIDRSFQTNFIIRFCLLILSATAIMAILIYWFNRNTSTVAFENLKVVVKSTSDFIMPITIQILVLVTLFTAMAIIVEILFVSHKISGPLFRLTKCIDDMKNGNLNSACSIRSSDQLQKAADHLEEMRKELNNSISGLKKDWNDVRTAISGIENTAIKKDVEKIDKALSRFITS